MRLYRSITAIIVPALMIALLAACGGSPSSSGAPSSSGGGGTASIPLYTGAKPLESGSPMAAAIDAAKQNLKQQQNGADTTVDAYNLPSGTSFDQVKKFYNDSLTGAGWKDQTAGITMPAGAGGGTAAWTKDNKEVFSVTVMPDPTSNGGAILLVAHAVQK